MHENDPITGFVKEDIVDVSGIILDTAIPQDERASWLIEKVKNPYCFRMGDMIVEMEFVDNGPTLQDIMTDFLTRQKSDI